MALPPPTGKYSGGALPASGGTPPAGGGSALPSPTGKYSSGVLPGSSAAPASSGGGHGILGNLGHALGSVGSLVMKAPDVVGTIASAGGKELFNSLRNTNETQQFLHPAKALQQNSVFSKQGRAAAAKNSPLSYGAVASLGTTLRQVPDTAAAVAPGGVGFGQSSLGQQIKKQGVLPTIVAKGADIATLAGGIGVLGDAAGLGDAARASKLAGVADESIKAAGMEGKIATAADAEKAATAAAAAGNVSAATNLDAISKTLAEKEALEASAGTATGAKAVGQKVTSAAKQVSHLGGQVAGAPFKPYELGAKLASKIPFVADGLAKAGEAVRSSKLGKEYAAAKDLHAAAGEDIRGEQARLNSSTAGGFRLARTAVGGDATAEAATILDRVGTARAAGQHLDGLSDEELGRALGVHATPEAFKLAADYSAGRLAPEQAAALDAAGQALDRGVYAPKQARFTTAYGEADKPSAATLASRQSEIDNPLEPSPAGHAAETAKLQAPILTRAEKTAARLKAASDKLDTASAVPTTSDERLLARKGEAAKRARLTAEGEAARSDRLVGTVLKEQGKNEATAANRTGQVMGRGADRLETQGQLDTGVESRAKQSALAARRAEKTASATEAQAAATRGESFAAKGERVTPETVKANAAEAIARGNADTAQAAADQLKGVKGPRSRGQVQSDISRDSRLANEKNATEASQTQRHLSGEATRQGTAQTTAERRQANAEADLAKVQDRVQQRSEDRLQAQKDRANKTLADARAKTTQQLGEAKAAAGESLRAAPAATRTLLFQQRDIAGNLTKMADEADAAGDAAKAADLRGRADALPKTLADLKAQGVEGSKYVFGGETPEEGGLGSGKPAPGPVGRKVLGSSRQKLTGAVPTTFEGQLSKALEESRDVSKNEFSPKLAERITSRTGVATGADLLGDHPELAGLKGTELADALKEAGYRPWDPEGSGRVLSGDALKKIDTDTAVIPREYAGKVNRTVRVPEGEDQTFGQHVGSTLLSGADKVTKAARFAKLIEPGWQFKKMLGDPAMLSMMGVSPADVVSHLAESIKAVRSGDLTPNLGAAAEGRLGAPEPESALGRAAQKTTNVMFTPFQKADAVAREVAYRAKLAEGYSPQAAAAAVRRGLGDLHDMTAAESGVAKRAFTFYPWQKHVAQTILRAPFEHPAGLLQAAHINQLAHPNGEPTGPSAAEQAGNPLLSSVLSMLGTTAADKQTGTLGSQVNPVVRDLIAGSLGVSPSRGFAPVSTPGRPLLGPGSGPTLGFAARHPEEFAKFVGHGLAPVVTAQNLINTQPAATGKLPQRFETGEPIRRGTKNTGSVKPATLGATTRKQALLQMLGIEPPQPAKKK